MSTERLLAYYERIADAPDAIARLRRFVLDLAVRGKLVPQDPRDEPAVKLLSRIAAETARLITKGESKQTGTTSQLAQNEMWPVPASWAFIPLELLATPTGLFTDGDWVESKDQDPDGSVRLTQLADVGAGDYRNRSSRFMNAATAARLNCTFLIPGDILIARMPDPLGRACIFPGDPKPCVTVVDVAVLRLGSYDFVGSYVVLAVNSQQFGRNVEAKAAGTTRSRISRGNLSLLPFPFPPVAEQHRIVAKVNELMALCDGLEEARVGREKTRDRLVVSSLARLNAPDPETFQDDARFVLAALPSLTTRPDQIKQVRETILNLAVRGRLVEQSASDEPASSRFTKNARELEGRLDVEMPSNWRWTRVEDVAEARLGKMLDKAKNRGLPYPYLRNTNVHWFDIRLDDLKTIPLEEAEFEEYRLQKGDVLICEGGHGIGRTAVWNGANQNVVFQKALHRVRPGPHLDPRFFAQCCFVYFDAGIMQTYFTGVGIPHFTGRALAKLVFPLPPLAEQHRIVAKVDEMMGLCDRLEARLNDTDAIRRRLLDALLAEALEPAKTAGRAFLISASSTERP